METPFTPFDPHGGGGRLGSKIRQISVRLLIPNLVTVLAICAGLSGIRLAFENRFEMAVIMVLVAAFLDGIDGRIARMLKATSKFGEQMDSLADIVNFGAAPALVLYAFMLDRAGAFGWIAALIFAIACGLRLARFNVQNADPDRPTWMSDYFTGVPAPAGAVLVLLPVYLGFLGLESNAVSAYFASIYTVIIALLLVSTLPVYSGKSSGARIRGDVAFPLILVVVLYVALLVSYPWQTLALSAAAYLAFLPFSVRMFKQRMLRSRREADIVTTAGDEPTATSADGRSSEE